MFLSTDNPEFKYLKCLEENYMKIKDEIPIFNKSTVSIKRQQGAWYDTDSGTNLLKTLETNKNWVAGWDETNIWYNFPLIANNNVLGEAEKICPFTINLLKEIGRNHTDSKQIQNESGNINIAGFSLILPNSQLPIHTDNTGPNFNSMALNMKLVGGICNLYVKNNNKFISHRHITGKAVIFNSELEHYADNKGTSNRIILYVDFKNKN